MKKDLIERIDFLLKFDKELSIGMVVCLEDHFSMITEMLDEAGIPKERLGGKALIVRERVEILLNAFMFANPVGGDLLQAMLEELPEEDVEAGMASGEELGMLIAERAYIVEGT